MRSPYALKRPVANDYLVRERDRRLVRDLAGVAASVLLVGAGLLGYTWIHVETNAVGYRIDQLDKQLHGLHQAERRLELEAAFRSQPRRLEARASEELGMRPPQIGETFFYDELRRATTAGTASGIAGGGS